MNNFVIENLSNKGEDRYILRNRDRYTCTIIFPLRAALKATQNSKEKFKEVNNVNDYISLYQFNMQVYNSSFMIQNYDYSSDYQYFKLDQHYYNSTLYSIKSNCLTYLQKLQTITHIAQIVKYFTDSAICIRTLRPQILSFFKLKSEIDVKIIWLDNAIKLENTKSQINKAVQAKSNTQIYPYLAPQIRLKKSYGVKADVWSLGVIFYQLLFGTNAGIIFNNQMLQVKYPANTPKWLQNILSNFLNPDPKKRCSINHCFSYLKPLKCCSQTASKLVPKCAYI